MKASNYYSLNLKKRPFQIFVLTSVVLFILSFFSVAKSTNVSVNDIHIEISWNIVYKVLSAFLLLMWLLYIFIKKRLLSKKLIWAHALATILPILAAIIYYNFTPQDRLQSPKTSYWAIYSMLLFVAVSAQFILILNIAGGIVKRLTKKRGRVLIHDTH
nr:hypothetical protein [Mucilaginibacter sp. L294]